MSVPVHDGGGGNVSEGSFGGCLPPAAPGRAAARGTRPAGRKGKEKGKKRSLRASWSRTERKSLRCARGCRCFRSRLPAVFGVALRGGEIPASIAIGEQPRSPSCKVWVRCRAAGLRLCLAAAVFNLRGDYSWSEQPGACGSQHKFELLLKWHQFWC